MNIVIFTDTFPPEINGVATSTFNLFNVLRKNGHNAYVVCTNPFSKEMMYEDNILRIPGIELKKLYSYRFSSFYSSKAMKIIKTMKPDVIHVNTEASIGIFGRIVAKKLRKPLVYTYHTMIEDYTYYVTKSNGIFDRIAKQIVRSFSKTMASTTTEFISPSEKTKDAIRKYGYESYINIVPTGIDFSKYESVNETEVEDIKKRYDLNDAFVILSLGRIAKEKSIDVIIDGFAKLKTKTKKKVKLLIVGGGPDLDNLKEQANRLKLNDDVVFVGPVDASKVPGFYHASNIFASASVTETQGLTFMEAMASRLLVLAKFDENLADVIIDNETGCFFNDVDDMARRVLAIMEQDKTKQKQIIENAYKITQKYSLDNFYSNIMEVYKRAIRKYW